MKRCFTFILFAIAFCCAQSFAGFSKVVAPKSNYTIVQKSGAAKAAPKKADVQEEPAAEQDESPVTAEENDAVYESSVNETAHSDYVVDAPVDYSDSVNYYSRLADELKTEGSAMKSKGVGMLIGGIVGAIGGIVLMSYVISNDDQYCSEVYSTSTGYECQLNGTGSLLTLAGLGFSGGGTAIAVVGGVKIGKGSRKGRQSREYRKKAERFESMSQSAALYFKPEVNPVKKSLGAKLALDL